MLAFSDINTNVPIFILSKVSPAQIIEYTELLYKAALSQPS